MDDISSAELAEWVAFEQLEPFGSRWDTWRSGQICATIANVNRTKGSRAYKAAQFFNLEDGGASGGNEDARSIWAKAALITEAYKARGAP